MRKFLESFIGEWDKTIIATQLMIVQGHSTGSILVRDLFVTVLKN